MSTTGESSSGRSERRPKADGKKARTRDAILTAAGDLFAQQGVHATTVEQIAHESNVSVATVYDHFGNKQTIAMSFIDDALDVLEELLRERKQTEDPIARIMEIGDAYLRFALREPAAWRFATARALQPEIGPEFEELRTAIAMHVRRLALLVGEDLREAMEAVNARGDRVDEALIFVWGAWSGVINMMLRLDGTAITEELTRRALAFGERVLGARYGVDVAERASTA